MTRSSKYPSPYLLVFPIIAILIGMACIVGILTNYNPSRLFDGNRRANAPYCYGMLENYDRYNKALYDSVVRDGVLTNNECDAIFADYHAVNDRIMRQRQYDLKAAAQKKSLSQ